MGVFYVRGSCQPNQHSEMTSELRLHKFHTNNIHCYPDLGSASDWSCREGNLLQPIKSATHIWVVNVITEWNLWSRCSDVTSQGTSGGVLKYWLFSQATLQGNHSLNEHIKVNSKYVSQG